MVTQEIIDFIKSSLDSGTDPEAIKSELRTKGMANDEIDAAFLTAKSEDSMEKEFGSSILATRKEIFIGLSALLILASLALIIYSPLDEQIGRALAAIIK